MMDPADTARLDRPGVYFTWTELRATEAPPTARRALSALCDAVLDPLRVAVRRPVRITSGYRDPARNAAAGGVDDSQHTLGEAVDVKVQGLTGEQLAAKIVTLGLPYDQLIWYAEGRGGHVHISYRASPRRMALHAPAGTTGYIPWTPSGAAVV